MSEPIVFTVYGNAVTQGNKTGFAVKKAGVFTGKIAMREGRSKAASETFHSWRQLVAERAQEAAKGLNGVLTGPVIVSLRFYFLRPASHPKKRRTWPIGARSGDGDKLARAVFDAITGVLIADDGQIVGHTVTKDYSPQPRCEVMLRPMPDGEVLGVHAHVCWALQGVEGDLDDWSLVAP